ncbi:type II toxin-antitoxin system VapC family toxin [Mesorhizobium cantuariense]|uniref:Type II toxin-antitoxin system VapC family toxin n=1 Tax=Mesorhizobium cantuariense TaxID=1300275 RepID=A0ABV7MVS7_9HYPH
MYLLDTQALTDLVSGSENAIRDRVERAEMQDHDVKASVVSFGLLKARILAMSDPSARDVWERRFEVARRKMRASGDLLEVSEATAMEFAFLYGLDLFRSNAAGQAIPLGDGDLLVLATAISEGFTLLTNDAQGYAEAIRNRGLLVEQV